MANQFRVLPASAPDVLFEHLRREDLKGTEFARVRVSNIRLTLFKIAAHVVVTVRLVVLRLFTGYPN